MQQITPQLINKRLPGNLLLVKKNCRHSNHQQTAYEHRRIWGYTAVNKGPIGLVIRWLFISSIYFL